MKNATIQKIESVTEIKNADKIEKIKLNGMSWQCVAKKDEFKKGDLCVFIPIDSKVPKTKQFDFLEKSNFIVKTVKLRGVLSQGLVLPIKEFKTLLPKNVKKGDDVSDFLGVKHYEKPISITLSGKAIGRFPNFIPKTDEVLLQNYTELLKETKEQTLYGSIKYDGTSSAFTKDFSGKTLVCSRNLIWAENEQNVFWKMFKKYNIQKALDETKQHIAIYAEIIGPKIQKNRLCLKEHEMRVFDVFAVGSQKYFGLHNLKSFCKKFNLPMVEITKIYNKDNNNTEDINFWINEAKGLYPGTNNRREGIVVRTITDIFSETINKRTSFKVLNNNFLLKDEK